jgi:hypothetical protein
VVKKYILSDFNAENVCSPQPVLSFNTNSFVTTGTIGGVVDVV